MQSLLLGLALSLAAQSSGASGEDVVKYKSKTLVEFTDLKVTGEIDKPGTSYIRVRRSARFSPMVSARKHFLPELFRSIDDT